MRIDRATVHRIQRLRGGNLIWTGPFGAAAWKFSDDEDSFSTKWRDAGGGALRNVVWHEPASLQLELPDRFEVELRLISPARPEFVIVVDANFNQLRIETWDDEIVVFNGPVFQKIGQLEETDLEVGLRLFWDTKAGSGAICSESGEILTQWDTSDKESPTLSSKALVQTDEITLTNKGAGLDLTRLRIRDWNGELPKSKPSKQPETGVELTDGDFLSELPQSLNNGQLNLGGRRLALIEFQSAVFPKPKAVKPVLESAIEVRMEDSTRFHGRILAVENRKVHFETASLADPLPIRLDLISEMSFPGDVSEKELAQLDTLALGENEQHGTWNPDPSADLLWRMPGATAAVALSKDAATKARIIRATPSRPWIKAPALFHLTSQEIASAELIAIEGDGETVRLRSDLFETAEIDQQLLRAVVLAPAQVRPAGFSDSGWRAIGDQPSLVTAQKSRTGRVVIQPGGAWGHSHFLQGHQIEFQLLGAETYSTLMVRLFCDDLADRTPSTNLMFFRNNNRVYFGHQQAALNQVSNQQNAEIDPKRPVPIKIRWDADMTYVTVAQASLEIPNDANAPRAGLGIVFEPGNMWNNGLRTVSLSHLRLKNDPGYTWAPSVSGDVKQRALFVPRFRSESPPRHALFAPNGDLLRGTIEAVTSSQIAFRSGLETVTIPRERAAAAVWLQPPADDESETTEEDEEEPKIRPETHWVILGSGARFGLKVERFGPEFVEGTSPLLGACRLPVDQIHGIFSERPDPDPATLAFADWKLQNAPFPAIPGADGGSEGSMEGEAAPNFTLNRLSGEAFELAKSKGGIVVLDFWATWCGPCVRAMPELREALANFPSDKVSLIAVNQGEGGVIIQDFLVARGWKDLDVVLDPNQTVGADYGVEGIPHTVVIGADGEIAMEETGYRPGGADAVANVIQQLLDDAD